MPIVSVTSDPESLTLTAVGEYPVPVERLWAAWADPRQLEQFWGPPAWPATFLAHDMRVGGESRYVMTGPKGEASHGYWAFDQVDAPVSFELRDGFCDETGTPNDELPHTRMRVTFEATPTGSRFVAVSTFASPEAMEQLLELGVVEGLTRALGQMDAVLDDLRETTRHRATLDIVDDRSVRIVREVRGHLADVWRAHHEAELVKQWMLGPDGWRMPVCETATAVGETYRYEWENEADGSRFGFVGEVLESEAPWRELTTERLISADGEANVNELTLVPLPGHRTRIELVIRYPSREVRDIVLESGMVEGLEASYGRLDQLG